MNSRRRTIATGLVVAGALAAGPLLPSPASASGSFARILIDDLTSPKGIAIGTDGSVLVGQGAFGAPAPVLAYDRSARPRDRVTEVTDPFNIVDLAISPLDGTGWAIATDLVVYHQLGDGSIVPVLDMAAYQAGDPDPYDQDGDGALTNPYGLTVLPNGDALVADALNNDIVRVTPEGVASTFARLDVEEVATDHLGPESGPLPPTINAEAVPTSVTVGPDGAVYVGELKGFPFRPGSSNVWRIEPDADEATCSVNTPDPDCTVYASNFTAIQDIAFNVAKGWLYVYELAEEGVLAFEAGFVTGDFPAAVLYEVRRPGQLNERRRHLAYDQLYQPGGVAIGPEGQIYVTSGIFPTNDDGTGGGRLSRVSR